jgi:hypothetical protein
MGRVGQLAGLVIALLTQLVGNTFTTASEGAAALETEAVPIVIENGIWAWSDDSGKGYAIFISRQEGKIWGEPEVISLSNGINVAPAVIGSPGEDSLIVWSSFTGEQSQLHYRLWSNGTWGDEIAYNSGLRSNTTPAVALDGTGRLWLVWTGFSGISDEIFFSFWQGEGFIEALPITVNDTPDILPILGIDNITGLPWTRWQRLSGDRYTLYQSAWNGESWSQAQPVLVDGQNLGNEQATALLLGLLAEDLSNEEVIGDEFAIDVPDFVTTPGSAAVHIPGYAVQSLPLRALGITD